MFTQFNIKKDLKNFLDEVKSSVMKELDNMTYQKVFGEVVYESLTPQQKMWTLLILLFIFLKRNSTLTLRACADGCQQSFLTNKENVKYHCYSKYQSIVIYFDC